MDKKTDTTTFDKDELLGAAVNLDSAMYLMQDITEDFFCKFNPESNEDKFVILYEFGRYRAFTQAVYELLFSIQKEFKEYGITPYED